MKKNVFIIGLGKFGKSLALLLNENGYDVTVSDIDKSIIDNFSASYSFDNVIELNSSNLEVLKSTTVTIADYVVVAISKIEDSILTCVNLKDLGVKNIIAKAQNKVHSRVLRSLGIVHTVIPEEITAQTIASKIINEDIDIFRQGTTHSIIRVKVSNDKCVGHLISDYTTDEISIFGVLKNEANADIKCNVQNHVIHKLDTLYIMCKNDKLKWIKKTFIQQQDKKSKKDHGIY